jgi:hypothetical protein
MKILGNLLAFRNDDERANDDQVVYEVTEVRADGRVEIAFDFGKERIYVAMPFGALCDAVAKWGRQES